MRPRSFLHASVCSVLLVSGMMPCAATRAAGETRAISDPDDVANPPLSWVCLNPQTRQYQALKAASVQQAQRAVDGDSSTPCKAIPAVLDAERVAQELNTQDTR